MSYYSRLRELELSRKIAVEHQIARSAYQEALERQHVRALQTEIYLRQEERERELKAQIALEDELASQKLAHARELEIQARMAHEQQLILQRQASEARKAKEDKLIAIQTQIDAEYRSVNLERTTQ